MIHPDKAPGPDGFSAGFYQAFWDVIGDDIYKDVRQFFVSSYLPPRLNETHVRLIPKTTGAKKVSDYRPIALCNTQYKIVAKILSKRLKPLLNKLVSPSQSAFVAGRSIADNVLITHEMLHFLRQSGARKYVSMAVKTDMSKAYDRIEWGFLRLVLERLGFHDTFTTWVLECVSSVSYSFLINGGPQGRVLPERGLRQGDPLSPYLFILCTEVLSGLCNNALRNGTFPGIKVARNCPPINHLLFADDTMFFGKSSSTSCATLVKILSKYEQASGQCINRAKSAVTFSSKTNSAAKERVKRELNITSEGGIGKYLGLPEHFGRKKRDIFASIVDRIRQRAHGWTTRFLSGAGKLVLLKSVLAAMPTYAMSCFKLPKSLCKQIQSVLTRFWWDMKPELRKLCWVSWDKLTRPKSAGGLGFREIENFNDALLAKHTWRLLKDPNSLLGQTLLNKYCRDGSLLDCYAPNSASHGWRGILAGRDIIKRGMGWVIGNGESVNIWKENWLSTTQQISPIGPPTVSSQNLRVKDLRLLDGTDWDLKQIRLHLPLYENHIRKLIPSSSLCDERVWLGEKSGRYTTRSGYALAKVNKDEGESDFNWKKCIWNVKCSPKLKHFLWKVKNKALAVGETLVRRGILAEGKCKRCGESESIFHVMFTCPIARKTWSLVPAMLVPRSESCLSVEALLNDCMRMKSLPPTGLTMPLYPWLMWVLWTSRNQYCFEDKSFSESEMVMKAIKLAKEWQQAQMPKTNSVSSKDYQASKLTYQPLQVPQDSLIIYSDAAWNSSTGDSGMGWFATDQQGNPCFQGESTRRHVASALVAEALALKSGLEMAVSKGYKDVFCLSDSRGLVDLLTENTSVITLQGLLHDLGVLSSLCSSISFKFISRDSNSVADRIAKNALFEFANSPSGLSNSV